METWIIIVIAILLLLLIIGFLFRALLKFAVACIVIYALFHIGYVWSTEETVENLKVDSWLQPDKQEKFEELHGTFGEKRDEFSVLDTDEMSRIMNESLDGMKTHLNEMDKKKILAEWEASFDKLTSEEAKQLMNDTKDTWSEFFSEEEMQDMISN